MPTWRWRRLPHVERPPDAARIRVIPKADGQAEIVGQPGAAGDRRARIARIVNLRSSDRVFVPVGEDGGFRASLFAPPGSWLQINTILVAAEDLPPEARQRLRTRGAIYCAQVSQEPAEPWIEFLTNHPSSSPGTILFVAGPHEADAPWPGFVKRVAPELRLFGRARASRTSVEAGDDLDLTIELRSVGVPDEDNDAVRGVPEVDFFVHSLFDASGRQRPSRRLSVSHLLTPTGLPIETHGEMATERRPDGANQWHHAFSGWPVPRRLEEPGAWRLEGQTAVITQRYKAYVPEELPPGLYALGARVSGIGTPEYGDEGPLGGSPCVGYLRVGSPARPRLACLLLGSAGSGGSRGTIAREDCRHYAVNPRNVLMPEKLVVARDDAYTGNPIRYPLDPYLPMLSLTERPPPVIPGPAIPLEFTGSRLTVTVTTPEGKTEVLGPAPLAAGQNDMSVLRPDLVLRDRLLPPVAPTYGNPSLSDLYHLTGRGAFGYAFRQYGRYEIRLDGAVKDLMGTSYAISGTYDVYVAKPLDIDVFPEPGTPLEPGAALHPQVRVLPAVPAEVEMVWRYYPGSDAKRARRRRVAGTANRFGVFLVEPDASPIRFDEPGEYVCDVSVRYQDSSGVLWMASRRGASVVVTPGSNVMVHGERGNRSPTARWRARWFVAGDGRFLAPPEPERPARESSDQRADRPPRILRFGHTCYPYESGDVAWLGDHDPFSLFPNLTFEDPEGALADVLQRRWPGVRQGEGREGLYPRRLLPEDRRAIGELPYVCMTAKGLPPTMNPSDVDLWGYFYTTSWRPGVGVRSQVSEDLLPTGYWFFDDPYGYQFGNGPVGDLAGDVKMNYGGGVFRDARTGLNHYGAYASMLVLVGDGDPRGPRVLPPFDGLVPGSPPCGPLVEMGGKRYDVFLTFGAMAPGAILEVGDPLSVAGVVWPPVSGHVRGAVASPSGRKTPFKTPSNAVGMFDFAGPIADEPGLWTVSAEGICSGKTSVGTVSELVPEARWPRGGGLGLDGTGFPVPVVRKKSAPIAFDLPSAARARPPRPLVMRGRIPSGCDARQAGVVVSLPGQVIDHGYVPIRDGCFEYVYDPRALKPSFPNLDVVVGSPDPDSDRNRMPAWFDTVVCTFWAGEGESLAAGTVLLQGEDVFAQASTGRPVPADVVPGTTLALRGRRRDRSPGSPADQVGIETSRLVPAAPPASSPPSHSSLLVWCSRDDAILAGHPWSGEVTRLTTQDDHLRVTSTARIGGNVRALALSPDGKTAYAAIADRGEIVALDSVSLDKIACFGSLGRPWAVLCSMEGSALFVADFDRDRILRLDATTGRLQASSDPIDRPSCLALSHDGRQLFAVGHRTGELVVLDLRCRTVRRLAAPAQLNQCRAITVSPDGLLYMPQTRSDTVVGGRTFDRSVFPAVAVANPSGDRVSIRHFPDLLVVPPHRPAEAAVDARTVYLASSGSDDVLAIDRQSGFARWHARDVGLEPGGIALDPARGRLFVLTIAGQEILLLDARDGAVLSRARFANDATPAEIARGRYLFGTATDPRLTKDQWMSCAVCHPDGETDGRQWDLGEGPLDTRSLRGCLETAPLHYDGHLDRIRGTGPFARTIMAGQWFRPLQQLRGRHDEPTPPGARAESDMDALASYIGSLRFPDPPEPPAEMLPLLSEGKQIFFSKEAGCVQCHPPPLYTDSGQRDAEGRLLLHDVGTCLPCCGRRHSRLDTPSLLGLYRSDPYLHHGQAKTLQEVFTKFNPGDRHGGTSRLGEHEIRALAEFLRYLKRGS